MLAEKSDLGDHLIGVKKQLPYDRNWALMAGISEVDDTDAADILPKNCLLVQLAKQKEKIVFIDKNLFQLLSHEDKVSILLHEIIYYYEIVNINSMSSAKVRQLVSYLTSESILEDDIYEVNERLKNIYSTSFACQIKIGENIFKAVCGSISNNAAGQIESFKTAVPLRLNYGAITAKSLLNVSANVNISKSVWLYPSGNLKQVVVDGVCSSKDRFLVKFDDKGNLNFTDLLTGSDLAQKITLRGQPLNGFLNDLNCESYGFELYQGLKLKSISRTDINGLTLSIKEGEKPVKFQQYKKIEFHENGTVKSGFIGENKIRIQGKKIKYGQFVEFDENGRLN